MRRSVKGAYDNLVTRATGRAVRGSLEIELEKTDADLVMVIDFSAVNCLDFSCADEVVAKLLLAHGTGRYFLLKGVTRAHLDAIEQVLERHGLAIVTQDRTGAIQLLGPVADTARAAFGTVLQRGRAHEDEIVASVGKSPELVREALSELCTRRLVLCEAATYQSITLV